MIIKTVYRDEENDNTVVIRMEQVPAQIEEKINSDDPMEDLINELVRTILYFVRGGIKSLIQKMKNR